jgi:hypothetical protein
MSVTSAYILRHADATSPDDVVIAPSDLPKKVQRRTDLFAIFNGDKQLKRQVWTAADAAGAFKGIKVAYE